MAHFKTKAPLLLLELSQGKSLQQACRDVEINAPSTVYRWLVASRLGKLPEIEFMDVPGKFSDHYENALSIAAKIAEQQIISIVAQGGRWVPCYKDGEMTYERLSPREMLSAGVQLEIECGLRAPDDNFKYDERGERIPQLQFIKSDAATNLRVLEAWNKRYRPGQTMDVVHHNIVRLGEAKAPVIDAPTDTVAFTDDVEESQSAPKLALPAPGSDHTVRPTKLVHADGRVEIVEPPIDPLLTQQAKPTASAPSAEKRNPLRDPNQPLQGDTSYMDSFQRPRSDWEEKTWRANPYRDRSHDQRQNPHADPQRGPPRHGSGREEHRGFKLR